MHIINSSKNLPNERISVNQGKKLSQLAIAVLLSDSRAQEVGNLRVLQVNRCC